MGPPTLLSLLLLLLWPLAAAAIIQLGLRSRGTTIPPSCRRCGYNVSQRPAGVERCSECGAELTTPAAIVTIRHRARRWITYPGAIALMLSLLYVGGAFYNFRWRAWFIANQPIGWIEQTARADLSASGDVYRREWLDRGNSSAYVDHVLDIQADRSIPWRTAFETELSIANRIGAIRQAQRRRFAANILGTPMQIVARSPVRVGDPLCLKIVTHPRGEDALSTMAGNFGQTKQIIAASASGPPTVDESRQYAIGTFGNEWSTMIRAKGWGGDQLKPGRHTIHVAVARGFVESGGINSAPLRERVDTHATVEIEVIPSGPFPATVVNATPAQADAIARAVGVRVYHWHDDRCFAEVRLLPVDVDRSFEVFVQLDGVERHIGSVAAKAGARSTTNAIYVPLTVEQAKATSSVTITLVGDPEPLVNTLDQTTYWPGRIVYADVPLGTWEDYRADTARSFQPTTVPYRIETAR